jgi:hypothetical protein
VSQSQPPFLARLRERLSPRTWALEWVALVAALLGLISQALPQLWPLSMRERLLIEGDAAEATVQAITRINLRNVRWGTDKKIGATRPVYLLDLTWSDWRGHRQRVAGFTIYASDAAKLRLDRTVGETPTHVRIRYLLPAILATEPVLAAADPDLVPPPCQPAHLCERVLIEDINTLNAKKFGDRPEPGLTIIALLVFAAMLAVRAIALVMLG